MECITVINSEPTPKTDEEQKLKISESAENFQHFIYELFEKNGILNDLRAYLRGHIVEVLKNAQTGAQPTCQKHFTQRLELTNQALNILVAEYLLRNEFSYSLSVFISEIPLANMVFNLAKTLMTQNDSGDHTKLFFSDSDVWSILNYLGIKCDSVHANKIVEKYKYKETPLLLCILKCLPFYCRQDGHHDTENSSVESISSEKSSESLPEQYEKHQKSHRHEKCKHYTYCKACQNRLHAIKDKYMKKKKNLCKNVTIPPENVQNVENLMKHVGMTEKALVDEMFNQLKNVYETEVELVKEEEEKRYKLVLAKFAVQLQRRQTEMEEKFKQREAELESAVQQKKKFLWGLAQALRDQHQTMTAAMSCVKGESERLSAKEDNLKSQLLDAENMIKKRGEEMRAQISNEIVILEDHLQSMKKERESIDKEKSELEKFKIICDSKMKLINDDCHLEALKKEIESLKKYVDERKMSVAEKCTMTDLENGGRMNNQEVGMKSDGEVVGRTPNQVINDLKKQKNVNFNQSHLDTMYVENRDRIRPSSAGFEERDARRDAILVLQDENERLKHFARQQEQHIDELNIQSARLQAELAGRGGRPRTAPAPAARRDHHQPRVNTSISATYNTFARSRGAGEDSIITARSVRNDGVRDRRVDSRRYLIQQWRALRRFPNGGTSQEPLEHIDNAHTRPSRSADTEPMRETAEREDGGSSYYTEQADQDQNAAQLPPNVSEGNKSRCKSPKSMLKEAKMKLRNKVKETPKHPCPREKSPNTVLREAKLRLRKLEIEAEAVEKSYLDFRKRQTLREENKSPYLRVDGCDDVTLDAKRSRSFGEITRQSINLSDHNVASINLQKCKRDLDKFLNNYENKLFITDSHFRNNSPNRLSRVIPEYGDVNKTL